MSLSRLGYASLLVPDMAAAVRHYTEIVGLRLIEQEGDERAYLQAIHAQDHHCLVLNRSARAGLDHAGFKVNDPADLARAAVALQAHGIESRSMAAGTLRGQGEGLRFRLPSQHDLVLYYHADKVGYRTGMENPDPVPASHGSVAAGLDHLVLVAERPAELAALLEACLGFYVTEQANGPDGAALAIFLSCTSTMHDLALLPGENGRLHHLAFVVESRSDVIACTDTLKLRKVPTLEFGVTRHGIAGVTTVYFMDPAGNRNEFAHGAYLAAGMSDRIPPVIWNADSLDRALFYYEADAPTTFMSSVT
jgi:catechol 2,3-dioxygenase